MGRKRIETGSGESQMIGLRLGASAVEWLDELARLLPSPVGVPSRSDVARAALIAGMRVMAKREGIRIKGLTDEPRKKPKKARARKGASGQTATDTTSTAV